MIYFKFLRNTLLYGYVSLVVIFPLQSSAQNAAFFPAKEDSIELRALYEKYDQQFSRELTQLPAKNRKDLVAIYQERWKNITSKFDEKEIFTDPVAQKYLDRLVAIIRAGNPSIQSLPFTCYFSRSYIPNAAYIGEGIILLNMGLFQKMNNEGQIAFVLCHEIAHCLLRHSENSMQQYVNTLNSDEVQEALHKIKGSAYRKNEQLQILVKGLTFDSRRHSRDHESEADSMAVELLRHTPFDLSCALSALAILDDIDKDSLDMSGCLYKQFNATQYPFRKKWIAHDEGLLGGHTKPQEEITDSLKTHPDCKKRISLLRNQIKGWSQNPASQFAVDSALFSRLVRAFQYEAIEYAWISKNYSESLFLCLDFLNKNPDDVYTITQVGKLFNGMFYAQKTHMLSKMTDLPSPEFPSNYNLLLQFIQNLYLEDLASINYYYLNTHLNLMNQYPPFQNVYLESGKLMKN